MLRYLAEAYRSLDRTVPIEKRDERLRDIISWLGFVVRSVDSSLVDEWKTPATRRHSTLRRRKASTRSWRTAAAARYWCATPSSAA